MSYRVWRHIPDFVEHDPVEPLEVADLRSLLDLPFVKLWATWEHFGRFVHDDDLLMVESLDRQVWHVVARVEPGALEGQLPQWKSPRA